MSTIVIKDLAASADLDRQAMHAIVGGARLRGTKAAAMPSVFRLNRIVDVAGKSGTRPSERRGLLTNLK